jgi:TolA-binding protein
VCIAAGALLKDNETGAILAQLKFKNLSSRVIAGLIVAVDAFDMGGSPLEGVPEYSYLDLMASRDTEFGQKKAILMPNSNTRRISARCTKVFFMDGGVWEAPVDAVWAPLGVPNTLESVLGQELADQYRRDTIGYAQFIPLEQQDLWTCTCGTINRKEEGSCHRCSSRLSSLLAATNKDTLSAHLAEKRERDRIAAEKLAEEQRIAAEKAAANKKKLLKITSVIAAILVAISIVCLAAFLVVTKVVIPSNDYKAAEALLAAGDYDGAIAAFTDLGDYKDASQRVADAQFAKNEDLYIQAESLFAAGEIKKAALLFGSLDNFMDSSVRSAELWMSFVQRNTVVISGAFSAAVTSDKTVVMTDKWATRENVNKWSDIVAISSGGSHILGLKSDGTIVADGNNTYGQCNVQSWSNIVAICAGANHTVGRLADGLVVAVGNNDHGQCNVENWRNIVAICSTANHTIGLCSDGTVVAAGNNDYGQCDVEDWTEIVAISAGPNHTVGLKANGTVVAVGQNVRGQCNTDNWRDIISISAGSEHTVGLKSDGTAVATDHTSGNKLFYSGQCDVTEWRDIVAISAGGLNTIGLKSDGTVVAVGANNVGQCEVENWTNLMLP